MKQTFYLIILLLAQNTFAEAPSVTIAAACQQGVLSGSQCPTPARACVHEAESSTESIVEVTLGGRTLGETVFGNETGQIRNANGSNTEVNSCDSIGRIRAADVNRYVTNCDFVPNNRQYQDAANINSLAQLQLRDSMINAIFQDLAARSVSQINCRLNVFDNYIADNNGGRARLNSKAEDKFNQVRERIQGLILTKQVLLNNVVSSQVNSLGSCQGMGCSSVVNTMDSINSRYEAAIAAEISKIPFGYEPDVATALFAMAQSGQFNQATYFDAMVKAKNKYNDLLGYYTNNDNPQQNGGTLYCISNSYKKFAVSTGIVQKLLDSYPSTTLTPQSKEILQCKLNSKYQSTPQNIDSTFNAAFLVGGGIAAVLTAVPTAGGSLATYGAIAGIGLSAASFATQLKKAHEACRQRSFLTSPTGREICQADQDFEHEVNQANLSSCLAQSGLAALEAVPVAADVAAILRGRTAVARTADVLEEYNQPPIVVTATLPRSRKPTVSQAATPQPTSRAIGTTREPSTAPALPALTEQQISSTNWSFISRSESARQTLRRTRTRPNPDLAKAISDVPSGTLRSVIEASARIMNNTNGQWDNYIPELIRDVGESMLRSNIPSVRARALAGEITRNDVLRVLVTRARARGETFRSVTGGSADDFFETVRSGPFFDRFFRGSQSNHGVDIHLLQRDFLARNLPPENASNFNEMFDYFATPNGRKIWDEMFDSTNEYTLTSPEEVMLMVRPVLPLN